MSDIGYGRQNTRFTENMDLVICVAEKWEHWLCTSLKQLFQLRLERVHRWKVAVCFYSNPRVCFSGTQWKTWRKRPLCLCIGALLLRLGAHLSGPAGLHLVLIERRVLCAIPAGRFFTHADGEGGWRPFKWSTWRLWPVINEFAVSHGSCKETSGNKKKKKVREKGGYSDWSGEQVICARMKNGRSKFSFAFIIMGFSVLKIQAA